MRQKKKNEGLSSTVHRDNPSLDDESCILMTGVDSILEIPTIDPTKAVCPPPFSLVFSSSLYSSSRPS
jgi:hypothetical protein